MKDKLIFYRTPHMPPLPLTSREIKLKARPLGLPKMENFEVVEAPLPVANSSQVLVRNRYCRVSASLRMMISEGAEDVVGVPFPALRPGDTLVEQTLGEVVSAPIGSGLSPGDLVQHFLGWRQYAVLPVADCARLDNRLPDPVAILSHGGAAYAALTRGLQIRAGDTVFVTSAAGAIGSMAGQIARLLGAGRVIGSTSSRDKADRLISQLGYDAVVIRGETPIAAQLAQIVPDGIDVLFDNVGGEQLQAAVSAAREGARFVLVGALSGQLAKQGTGRIAPVVLDSFQVLLKKITLRGYSADDDPEAHAEWTNQFGNWLRSESIVFPHVVLNGIEQGPEAIQKVAEGRYFGTVIVEI
jgi:NADPH-dependent curcumin reductase CurA